MEWIIGTVFLTLACILVWGIVLLSILALSQYAPTPRPMDETRPR